MSRSGHDNDWNGAVKARQVLQHEDWLVLDLVQTGYHEAGRVYLRAAAIAKAEGREVQP